MERHRPQPARRSRLVAAGLSAGALVGLVLGMVAGEHPLPATSAQPVPTAAPAGDPFIAGRGATPPSSPARARIPQTVTSAS